MKTIQNISVVEDVTLVSLNDSPADMNTISKIFDMISTNNIDVDMISQTPPHSNKPHLSFTVSGDDLGKILELSAKIRDLYPDVKLSVSNGNCKISVFGEAMKGQPGVAAKVFAGASRSTPTCRSRRIWPSSPRCSARRWPKTTIWSPRSTARSNPSASGVPASSRAA